MEDPCYKIVDRPVSLNEGNYRVNFDIIDPKKKMAYFPKKATTHPKKRFFKVSPCLMNETVCSLKTRKAAKEDHG
jgi:hypothetical protein